MKSRKTLWTPNFTIITLGTIISAIGGVGISFAMSIVVFKETGSTFLSGLYTALTLIPQLVLPLLIGPMIDRISRKKLIVRLDVIAGLFFLLCAFLTRNNYFHYALYVTMGILMNINGIIYSTAYSTLFPDLIPEGFYQKGYSISSIIYPLSTAVFMPLAALCFEAFGTSFLFAIQGVLLLIAASVECFIKVNEKLLDTPLAKPSQYFKDIGEGVAYLRDEPGIRAVFVYFFFTMFCSQGISTLIIPFFETHPILTMASYSILISTETCGRFFSGVLNYTAKFPAKKKYTIATSVYLFYEIADAFLMFVAFPTMLIIRFLLGVLGTTSANIRMSSIQSYIPSEKRGRINGISGLLSIAGVFCGSLLSGVLGEFFPYPMIGFGYGVVGVLAVCFIIIRNKTHVAAIYNREV